MRKRIDKKMIAGLVIAFLMISSVFGFVLSYQAQDTSITYNKHRFNVVQNQYQTNIDGKKMTFLLLPYDVESIKLSDEAKQILTSQVLTVSYDQNSTFADALADAQYYLEYQLENKRFIERGMLEEGELPKRTCDDATPIQPVIELRQSNETKLSTMPNCLIIESFEPIDVYRHAERILYHIVGIIP